MVGPTAIVYPRADPRTGEPLAVKVYHRPFDPQTRAEVAAEQTALAGLRHVRQILPAEPGTLPDGRTTLSMPRCPQSLTQRVRATGPLAADDALAVAEAVAVALAAAHRAGVVHGGVHPHNVLFTAAGEPVLADFGVSARRAAGALDSAHLGFAAPETLRDGTRDERSDLYGLGAVLHCALTGNAPHPAVVGEPEAQRILRVLSSPAPTVARADVPDAAKSLLAELLAARPEDRPSSASAVAGRLTVLLSGGTPADVVKSAAAPARPAGQPLAVFAPEPPQRPSRAGPIAVAVAAVAALAVLVALLVLDDDTPPAVQQPPPTTSSARFPTTQTTPPPDVKIRLSTPRVDGNQVDLRWRGPRNLDYNVRLAEEGRPGWDDRPTGRRLRLQLTIRPGRGYCFQVQATDGDHVFQSSPRAIRGGECP